MERERSSRMGVSLLESIYHTLGSAGSEGQGSEVASHMLILSCIGFSGIHCVPSSVSCFVGFDSPSQLAALLPMK